MKTQQGFTLIELMITVVVVAILASIALPSYGNYVIRSRIPDATSTLAAKRVQMEQFFQDNRTYVGATANGVSICGGRSNYFTYSCSVTPTASVYTINATGTAGTSMAGFTYTIDQSNTKASNITAPTAWVSSSTSCWITNQGGSC